MRYTIIVLSAVVLTATQSASAAEPASKEESIGVGVGLAVGAAAGGPIGAIVGAAVGGSLGNRFHHKDLQVESLQESLARSGAEVLRLEDSVASRNAEIDELRSKSHPELLALLQTGIEMDLLFRTDEHVLSDGTGRRVAELARTLAAFPDIRVRLDGYADERGNESYNRRLSEMRAQHVRELLVRQGIGAARITTAAHGEAPAVDDRADSYALQRRVSLTLFVGEAPAFAAATD